MSEFDSIRPYGNDEVRAVVDRLVGNTELRQLVAELVLPRLSALAPRIARFCAGRLMRWRARGIRTVLDFQLQIGRYLDVVIRSTIDELTVTGLERLDSKGAYLFISNHRDIVLDSGLINVLIYEHGFDTCQLAVGDNLFSNPIAADVMRLNKGFMVERQVTGTRAVLAALTRTARYIRQSLESGESVWLAQRGGRAKDGFDRTDPALVKMLGLAFRKEIPRLGVLPQRLTIVPVAISYEFDPSDALKARELKALADSGHYEKADGEDLGSIAAGIRGPKGRVHVHFGTPLEALPEDAEDEPRQLAEAIDQQIVAGLRLFDINREAAKRLASSAGDTPAQEWLNQLELDALAMPDSGASSSLTARLDALPVELHPWLLTQYANVLRNKLELLSGSQIEVQDDPAHANASAL
ncbi:MAG: 1-acyl-sn-glycerol-3-phosphate acyltransferase [Pseudomonadota bacterium]